jgi:hypothetical protein
MGGTVYLFLERTYPLKTSRDSSVGIATGYGAGLPRGQSSSPGGGKNFHFSTSSIPALGPPASYSMGAGALSPGVKRMGREADHSPPPSAEVKKTLSLYIHSPIRLHGVVLNQLRTRTALPFIFTYPLKSTIFWVLMSCI